MTTKRKVDRTRSLLRAQASFNNTATALECVVKNISSAGARLEISDTTLLPAVFDLTVPHKARTFRARIIWRQEGVVGVEFISNELVDSDDSSDHLSRLEFLENENIQLKLQIRALKIEIAHLSEDGRSPI